MGSAKSATRSAGGPVRCIASRWSVTISCTLGSSRRIRRTVNSGVSIRRSRVWSGGSNASIWPARSRLFSSSLSPGLRSRPRSWARWLLNRSGLPNTNRTSANRLTSQAGTPKAVVTLRIPGPSRSSANSGIGLNSSRRMYSGNTGVSVTWAS